MSDTEEPGSKPLHVQRQEIFCLAVFSGRTPEEAAVAAGYSPKTARNQAAAVLKMSHVQDRLAFLRKPIVEAAGIALGVHLDALKTLRDAAVAAHEYSAAISAEVARGKASGLYVTKSEQKIGLNGMPEGADLEFRVTVRKVASA